MCFSWFQFENQTREPILFNEITFFLGDFNIVRNISLTIKDDSLFEEAEQFLVELSSGNNDKVEVLPPVQATVNIIDNDRKLIVSICNVIFFQISE
jgi:hypothetical protein